MEKDFILFGEGNYNTLGVLHELQECGVTPLLLIVGKAKDRKKGNIIGYSRYAKRIVEVSSFEEGLDWLVSNRDAFVVGTIVYPTSDNAEKLLDGNFDLLSPHFRFPNAGSQDAVSGLMDKQRQTELAEKSGLRVLQSQYTTSPDFSLDKVKYPCMVKPLNSTRGTKGDMRVCEDEVELKEALASGKHTHDFIVQQYIRNEADLLFLGVSYSNGDVWLPAVVVKPGVSPVGEYTHALISTDVAKFLPEIESVKDFVRWTKYVGPFSIEFGLERGLNYFFEINLRNDGTSHYPLRAGVNIAKAYIDDEMPKTLLPIIEYEMIDEVGDLRRVQRGELSFKHWLNSFRNAGTYRFYKAGDYPLIMPLASMFMVRSLDKVLRLFKQ